MKYFFVIFSFTVFLWTCKEGAKDEIKLLHSQVMQVHDDAMVKMSDIHKVKKELSSYLQSSSDTVSVMTAIHKLDEADEAMMVWMQDFNASYDTLSKEEQKKYLLEELNKINIVSKMMFSSIEQGGQLIKK